MGRATVIPGQRPTVLYVYLRASHLLRCRPSFLPLLRVSVKSLSFLYSIMANIMKCDLLSQLIVELEPQLSRTGLLSSEIAPRWSSFHAPRPAVVVNAETEQDVAKTVTDFTYSL